MPAARRYQPDSAMPWLPGFGGKVEVIGPAPLRRDIASRLRAAASRYARQPR